MGEYPALSDQDIQAITLQIQQAHLDRYLSALTVTAEHLAT